MINLIKKQVFVLLSIASLTSCATIVHGTRQSIGISSNPSYASVWVDQIYMGNTPIIVDMSRKDNHIVRIELDGYQPYEVTFSRKVSGWVLGNLLFGGVIGLAVDAISGGIYCLTPEQVQAELRNNQNVYSKNSDDSYIAIVLQPDPSWTKVGNMVVAN
ncbi:MAG: PEGA domain-containing protein [Parachlamydiaceae bacterium]|nr:PEGA domain-containing protein [Parachlamydiaceae bacterium]